uniref:Peptidase S8/S53 domain-containing protein n=1 Tax=Guillardia theta TaxID=55529 RepID=A0A6U5W4B8_GUITH
MAHDDIFSAINASVGQSLIDFKILLLPHHMRYNREVDQVIKSMVDKEGLGDSEHIVAHESNRRVLSARIRRGKAAEFVSYVSELVDVLSVEVQGVYMARNLLEDKILMSGTGLQSEISDGLLLKLNGLTGSGQLVSLSDTGLDYDNCMLWQPSFPWFCLNPARAFQGLGACSASAYAGLLGERDFSAFIQMMLFSARDTHLLDSGTTAGVPSRYPPLNARFRDRRDRIERGYVFSLRGDPTIALLVDSWAALRGPLLRTLQVGARLCAACGGNVTWNNGVQMFVSKQTYAYDELDNTTEHLKTTAGFQWSVFSALLYEKCFCFYTSLNFSSLAPVDYRHPLPPVREFLFQAFGNVPNRPGYQSLQTAMHELCNITRGGGKYPKPRAIRNSEGVLVDICKNVSFLNGKVSFNTCMMNWEGRLLEPALSSCFATQYLPERKSGGDAKKNAEYYTYNTTLAWWEEYTRVPPFNRVDQSRRKVVGYQVQSGCQPCGMCSRLWIDSRDYDSVVFTDKMPALLQPGQVYDIYLQPNSKDWRLDSFQARNLNLYMNVSLTVQANLLEMNSLGVCVLENGVYAVAAKTDNLRNRSWWNQNCLNANRWDMNYRVTTSAASSVSEYQHHQVIDPLRQSADGWRLLVWNNGSSPILHTAALQLFTRSTNCSDKQDGQDLLDENTHSLDLGNRNTNAVAADDVCYLRNETYCDNTYDSGRQLDLCNVCGGHCFPPRCSMQHCMGADQAIMRIRNLDLFPYGTVSKTFALAAMTEADRVCPSPSGPQVACSPTWCNTSGWCGARKETYLVSTDFLTAEAGGLYTFGFKQLLFESSGLNRTLKLTVKLLGRPVDTSSSTRQGGVGDIALPSWFALSPGVNGNQSYYATFEGRNYSVPFKNRTQVEIVMDEGSLQSALSYFQYTPAPDMGTSLNRRQSMLEFNLQVLRKDGSAYLGVQDRYPAGVQAVTCKGGFAGAACDTMDPPMTVVVTINPQQSGQRVVPPGLQRGGRRLKLSRGGHGTHVATSMAGKALNPDSSPSRLEQFDGLAPDSKIFFVDIADSGSLFLTPPDIGDALLSSAYGAGSRVFVNPWTCEDYLWWKQQDKSFDPAQSVAGDYKINELPSICNRYTVDAWSIDDFVSRHSDMLVIFPAGDNGLYGDNTISSPGTCKNCLTVGTSQSWIKNMIAATDLDDPSCRPADCSHNVDQTNTCANPARAVYGEPSCCKDRYLTENFGAEAMDATSGRGYGVSQQAASSSIFSSLDQLQFARVKPELVAPGVNVIAGRSDGNPISGGNKGCRCCDNASKSESYLVARSGSSSSAAKVGALAALVRQYFEDGFYPLGFRGLGSRLSPSAALVKAMLVTAAAPLRHVLNQSGGDLNQAHLNPWPSRFFGFGIPSLDKVLPLGIAEATRSSASSTEIQPPVDLTCECTGQNKELFRSSAGSERFSKDYGTSCQPWNSMEDGRSQTCSTIFSSNPSARPVPLGVGYSSDLDETCCISWCFVNSSCPSRQVFKEIPTMFYSSEVCAQNLSKISSCPYKTKRKTFRMIALDHDIVSIPSSCVSDFNQSQSPKFCLGGPNIAQLCRSNSDCGASFECGNNDLIVYCQRLRDVTRCWDLASHACQYASFEPSFSFKKGSLSLNETVMYNFSIYAASSGSPLTVTLAYTDAPGSMGAPAVLVNNLDLMLEVTPIMMTSPEGTKPLSDYPRDRSRRQVYWGNGAVGGDAVNNVEAVRLSNLSASEVLVKISATSLRGSSPNAMNSDMCQPFALVILGDLDQKLLSNPLQLSTIPSSLPVGICGRFPKHLETSPEWWTAGRIAAVVVSGFCFLVLLFISIRCYRRVKQLKEEEETVNADSNIGIKYRTDVEPAEEELGVAQAGGIDFIVLDESASSIDNYYAGLPIVILEGAGSGEESVIESYFGLSRKALVEFEVPVASGSQYKILTKDREPSGYKVGSLGYVTSKRAGASGRDWMVQKQKETVEQARRRHGNLKREELEEMAIGAGSHQRSTREQVDAIRHGKAIGKHMSSQAIFDTALPDERGRIVHFKSDDMISYEQRNSSKFKAPSAGSRLDAGESQAPPPLRSSRALSRQVHKPAVTAHTWEVEATAALSPGKSEPLPDTARGMVTATLFTTARNRTRRSNFGSTKEEKPEGEGGGERECLL